MNIRKVKIQEIDKLHRLSPKSVNWKKYVEQVISRLKNHQLDIFVIEDNENFIGEITVNYVSHELETETIKNKRVYLEAFRIDKTIQNKGLGQKLIKYVINEMFQNGYTEFTIGVEDDNEIAKHIYFKLGFNNAIDRGEGSEFDPSSYTLYLKVIPDICVTIKNLVQHLNLGTLLEEPIRVTGGLLNRMYKVKTTKGIYAFKHLNPEVMKRKDAKENHILAEKIANISKENGLDCICAKSFNNTVLQELEGNYFLVFDWYEGKAICDTDITSAHVKKVATLLAKLHNIDFGAIKEKCNLGKEIFEVDWDYYISKLENQYIKGLLINKKEDLIALDKKSTECAKEIRSNLVVSHRDLDLPNILWDKGNNPVIIDWESSGVVNPCEELLETAWDWSGGQEYFDIEKFKLFVETYKENNGDIKDIKKAIYSNFKNKSGWLEYNLKRVCKLECLDEEEQKLGEKEVVRVINEIFKFYDVLKDYEN